MDSDTGSSNKLREDKIRSIKNQYGDLSKVLDFLIFVLKETSQPFAAAYTDWRFFDCNSAFCELTGYDHQELKKINLCKDMTPAEWQDIEAKIIEKNLIDKKPVKYEKEYFKKDGTRIPVELNFHTIFDGSDNPLYHYAFFTDLTAYKNAVKAFRDSEELFRVLAETSSTGICLHQCGKLLYVNPAAEKMCGYTKEDIDNMSFYDIISPEYANILSDRRRDNLAGKDVSSGYEIKFITRNGKERWAFIKMGDIEFKGKPAIIVTALDITQHKKMEDALSRSEERYRLLAENAEDFIYIIDRELSVRYLNRSAAASLAMSPEEATGKPLKSLFPGKTFLHMKEGLNTVFGSGKPIISEHILSFYGKDYWLHVKLTPLFDKNGNVTCVMGISRDITDIKKAEEELRKSEANLLKAQKMACIGSWEWDIRNNLFTWSDGLYDISGIKPGTEISYEAIMGLLSPEDVTKVENSIRGFLRNGRPTSIEGSMKCPDGTEKIIYNECEPIYDDNGNPVRLIGISQDITERKKAEKALIDAKMQAELYVDLMSHDISNMNQISMGFLELALSIMDMEGNIGEDNRVLLEKSLEAMKNSTRIIDNVKKIQREKNGEYKPEVIDLCKILEKTISQYSNIPGRDINIKYSSDNCLCVLANELLSDVFSNLIGNSVKHSSGPLNIFVKNSLVIENNKKYCKVIIEDDGPGISEELKNRLFSRLKKENGKASGRGMGLFLIKTLISDFNGKIFVEDRVPGDHKKGSRFVVMIPSVDI